ncbi:methyl-accepting chemotaxis protein [Vibrio harveyi]|nr:methyl-accepting chemotaxis protein [Vibrio harveyi]GBL00080.1 methyl-accepting chemotaxis protein [Vibrio harveyi]
MLNNLSIRNIMFAIFGTIIILLCIIVTSLYSAFQTADQLDEAQSIRRKSLEVGAMFVDSSVNLTNNARQYSVTGAPRFKDDYYHILAVRNGTKKGEDGRTISTQQRMKDLNFSQEEFDYIAEANELSETLSKLEEEAMAAVEAGDKMHAQQLLFSDAYRDELNKIRIEVKRFEEALEQRLQNNVYTLREDMKAEEYKAYVSLVVSLAIVLFALFIVMTRILRPLTVSVGLIRQIASSNDLTIILPEGKNEIGQVGVAFNLFRQTLIDGLGKFIGAIEEMKVTVMQVNGFVQSSEQKGAEQNNQLTMIATAMEEMVATLKEVAANVSDSAQGASEAEEAAMKGKSAMDETNGKFEGLFVSFNQSAETIRALSEESSNMTQMLDAIKAIAEQTNLLALNAAIEAARAGEQGRGFAVVADEVRSLAGRSQESASEIEHMLGNLQTKAQSAVDSIERNTSDMRETKIVIEHASEILSRIAQSAVNANELNNSIATATEEQQSVSEDINMNISQLHEGSQEFVGEMAEFSAAARRLDIVAENVEKVTQQFKIR